MLIWDETWEHTISHKHMVLVFLKNMIWWPCYVKKFCIHFFEFIAFWLSVLYFFCLNFEGLHIIRYQSNLLKYLCRFTNILFQSFERFRKRFSKKFENLFWSHFIDGYFSSFVTLIEMSLIGLKRPSKEIFWSLHFVWKIPPFTIAELKCTLSAIKWNCKRLW